MRYYYFYFFSVEFFSGFFFYVSRRSACELVAQRRMLARQAPPMQAMTAVFFSPRGALVAHSHLRAGQLPLLLVFFFGMLWDAQRNLRARQVALLAQETAARAADAGCGYDGMRP